MPCMSSKLFIKARTVLTPHGFLDGATVEVHKGMITALWPSGGAQPEPQDEILDLGDQALVPGLVNAHTHAAMNLFRGVADDVSLKPWLEQHIWPREAHLTEEAVFWGTQLALLEMIASGTTTFSDMYIFMDGVARAARDAGIRAVLAQGLFGDGDSGRAALEEGIELYYRYHGDGDGRLTVLLGPHAPYTTSPEFLEQVAQAASDLGTGVHIHLSETRDEVEACWAEHGCSPVGLLFRTGLESVPLLAAHAVHLDEADIDNLKGLLIGIAHCPISNLKLGCGMAPISRYLKEHVVVGLGSDGAASANTLDLFLSMKASAWGSKGWTGDPTHPTARDLLYMATEGGARAVGLGEVTGRIQPGLRADLVGIGLDAPSFQPLHDLTSTLVYSASGASVRTVIVDGRTLYRDGAYLTLDKDEIVARAREVAGKLALA